MRTSRSTRLIALSSLIALGTPSAIYTKKDSLLFDYITPIATGMVAGIVSSKFTAFMCNKFPQSDARIPIAILSFLVCSKFRRLIAEETLGESETGRRVGLLAQMTTYGLLLMNKQSDSFSLS